MLDGFIERFYHVAFYLKPYGSDVNRFVFSLYKLKLI